MLCLAQFFSFVYFDLAKAVVKKPADSALFATWRKLSWAWGKQIERKQNKTSTEQNVKKLKIVI